MRKISVFFVFAVSAWAQLGPPGKEPSFFSVSAPPAGPKLQFNAVVEPPLSNSEDLKLGWGVFYVRTRTHDVWHRLVYDTVHQQYFGYDLFVDQPQTDLLTNQPRVRNQYRVTFAPLSIEPDQIQPKGLSLVALSKYPEPQTLMPGDVIAVDLLESPNGKRKVVDYVEIAPLNGLPTLRPFTNRVAFFKMDDQTPRAIYESFGRVAGIEVSFDPAKIDRLSDTSRKFSLELVDALPDEAFNAIAIATHTFWKPIFGNSILVMQDLPRPTSTGAPKDYTLDDGPLKFDFIGEVSINGERFAGPALFLAGRRDGFTPWFSFPGKGRFVLSLAPHAGFVKAGAIRDNEISFRAEGQVYQITMNSPVVGSGGVWNLYLLHERSYQLDGAVLALLPSGLAGSGTPMVVGRTDRLENLLTK